MNNLQRLTSGPATVWRALPTWAKALTVISGAIATLYAFQVILGFLVIAAIVVGLYTIVKWLVSRP